VNSVPGCVGVWSYYDAGFVPMDVWKPRAKYARLSRVRVNIFRTSFGVERRPVAVSEFRHLALYPRCQDCLPSSIWGGEGGGLSEILMFISLSSKFAVVEPQSSGIVEAVFASMRR
jgi:hypothetical protein